MHCQPLQLLVLLQNHPLHSQHYIYCFSTLLNRVTLAETDFDMVILFICCSLHAFMPLNRDLINLVVFTLSTTILYTAILYWDRSYTEWFDINYFLYMQWIITHSRHLHRDVKHCNPFVQWFFTHMILCIIWSFIHNYI